MDFVWVMDALRRGLKVTRTAWAGDPPMYLYMSKKPSGERTIMMYTGTDKDIEWYPPADLLLDASDWEEYVQPADKRKELGRIQMTVEKDGTFKLSDSVLPEELNKMHEHHPELESSLKKVWTTFYDLDVQLTGALVDKADYPYVLCERYVEKIQKDGQIMVLAEPGFSQRTVHLRHGQDCWLDAKTASAALIHRIATRYGWNMESFITLLDGVDRAKGDYNKQCFECESGTLGQKFAMEMENWAQENAKVMHRLYYVVNQYINLVRYEELERSVTCDKLESSCRAKSAYIQDALNRQEQHHV